MRHNILKKAIFMEIPPAQQKKPRKSIFPGQDPYSADRRPVICIQAAVNLFSHPDYTVGTGIPSYQKVTGSAAVKQFADYTAGWDLHPTPKILFLLHVLI